MPLYAYDLDRAVRENAAHRSVGLEFFELHLLFESVWETARGEVQCFSGIGGAGGVQTSLDAGEPFALGGYVPAKLAEIGPYVVHLTPEVVYPLPENPPEKQG